MKKVNLEGKLSLKKDTIAQLNQNQMAGIKGGLQTLPNCPTVAETCYSQCDCPHTEAFTNCELCPSAQTCAGTCAC